MYSWGHAEAGEGVSSPFLARFRCSPTAHVRRLCEVRIHTVLESDTKIVLLVPRGGSVLSVTMCLEKEWW